MRTLFILCLMLVALSGCSEKVVTDTDTVPTIQRVPVNANYKIYYHRSDNMDRGHHDYYYEELVVDPAYYNNHDVKRGDVVYLESVRENSKLPEFDILRVVALPGEQVSINAGQLYINGKKLDTFYGKAHRLGNDTEELKQFMNNEPNNSNVKNALDFLQNINIDEIKVPKDHIYLIGDDWFRSVDSRMFGSTETNKIKGKVLGYIEKHKWEASPTFEMASEGQKESTRLRGEIGKLAIVDISLTAGKPYQNFWFFWGKSDDLRGEFKVIAVKKGEEQRRTVFFAGGLSGTFRSADASVPPSNMTIPTPGLWRLEAYIGDRYFGSIVVDVN
ncbi:signal peptidase I [Paenibacillus sp. V4I3]|uniref:signal peptidase I n=1 Tax=Paenibacillus sp. V4I3 TaxID=3042305 RepID=UPI00278021E3|nr:signal peptidase I [Paenibacillus sp. V4I3]MDQ0878817.1 signal peptidase I [Paenibacillus sp. V4I3]